MKYWILAISLLVMGCSGGESGGSDDAAATEAVKQVEEATTDVAKEVGEAVDAIEEGAESMGQEAADALNDAQESAAEVEDLLKEKKEEVDAAIEEATDN